jgi:putative membrane protein
MPLSVVAALIGLQAAYWLCTNPYRNRIAGSQPVPVRTQYLFAQGIAVLFLALTSPLHTLSDEYLFSAHMVQHLLLTLVAAPMLIAGTPGWLLAAICRSLHITGLMRRLLHPVLAFGLYNLVFTFAHLPFFYDRALGSDLLHGLEHVIFVTSSLLLWLPILSPWKELPRYHVLGQIAFFFAQTAPAMLLGGLITGAGAPLYPTYANAPRVFDLDVMADQQLAGLIMWVAGGTYFLIAAAVQFFRWAAKEESRNRRPDPARAPRASS